MKAKKRILPALVFSAFAAFGAAEAQSAQFSNVYMFGDSLTDAGYYRPFLRSLGLPEAVVAGMGRFTTNPGPVWSGSSYDVPAYASDTGFITAAIGITGRITPNVGLSVSAFKVQGRSGIEEGGVNAMVSARF